MFIDIINCHFEQTSHEQQSFSKLEKTLKKWDNNAFKSKKTVALSGTLFHTHSISHSEAEILIPKAYSTLYKPRQFYLIEFGEINIYLQASESQQDVSELTHISILKTIVDLVGVSCDRNGSFQAEIKMIESVPDICHIEYVEMLAKETYFSRRDQYKVMKHLRETLTNVFVKKILYFDEVKLEVMNLMRNNSQVAKVGVISKDTKIIFRSGCAKSTIMIELSKEMFLLNSNNQIYLEKALQVLLVYFMRNNFFNNKHNVVIVLFSRLFYPQFKSLREAYAFLNQTQTDISSKYLRDKFEVNFAVAFQKDVKGRIYQDAYRRITWPSNQPDHFAQYFWENISQFMFTINYNFSKTNSRAQFIADSVQQLVKMEYPSRKGTHIKPFIHRLKCELSDSTNSNLFESISLIAQQYSHHYHFRSLKETGNSILILSAGSNHYEVDQTTYKMSKSYVYLTNISCVHINLNKKVKNITVKINSHAQKPRYNKPQDIKKLKKLILWDIQESVYQSPMNQKMSFKDDFEFKSFIYPQQLHLMSKEHPTSPHSSENVENLFSTDDQHYQLIEKENASPILQSLKDIQWIDSFYFGEEALHNHHIFYDKTSYFLTSFQQPTNKFSPNIHHQDKSIQFADQLMKIISQKKQIDQFFSYGEYQNQLNFIIDKNQSNLNKRLFHLQVMSSNNNQWSHSNIRVRKNSDVWVKAEDSTVSQINIFEATLNKGEYQAIINNEKEKMRKKKSHNKYRLKNNYNQANIHYLHPNFSESILKQFRSFTRYEEAFNSYQRFHQTIEIEKFWKKICFPILTPLYTKCSEKFKETEENLGLSIVMEDVADFEEAICTRLMQNFQIIEQQIPTSNAYVNVVALSKGHIEFEVKKNGDNLRGSYFTDKTIQSKIIPIMLYRYLCYEEKDYRFCSKYINFQNKNYLFDKQVLFKQTKSLRIAFLCNEQDRDISKKINDIKQLSATMKEKYKQLDINLKDGQPFSPPITKSQCITLSEYKKNNQIYTKEKITLTYPITFNIHNLYIHTIDWDICSSALLNEFIANLQTLARRNKLNTFLITKEDPFNIKWSMETIAEIVFKSELGINMMKTNIDSNFKWLWDQQDFYMDEKGLAFIKIKPTTKLILWKDNNYQPKPKINQCSCFFNKFFMRAAVYDFIGEIIEEIIHKKHTKTNSESSITQQKN